jgi:hypothetical protein
VLEEDGAIIDDLLTWFPPIAAHWQSAADSNPADKFDGARCVCQESKV